MSSLRQVPAPELPAAGCCRCGQPGDRWDRVAGKPYCPQCEELLAAGESAPLIEPTQPPPCAICGHRGTVSVQTYPLEAAEPLEMDLCPEHLRSLLSRRLGPHGYHQLQLQLQALGLQPADVFLLHEAFYDGHGKALQPVQEVL